MDYYSLIKGVAPKTEHSVRWVNSPLQIKMARLVKRVDYCDLLTIMELLQRKGVVVNEETVSMYIANPFLGSEMLLWLESLLAYGFGIVE